MTCVTRSELPISAAVAAAGLLLAFGLAVAMEAESAAPAAMNLRPAWLASRELQEQDIAGVIEETTFWVEAADERFLVISRPPVGAAARGTLLFLTDETAAPDGHTRSATLRRGLARYGWHTFFARLDAAPRFAAVQSGPEGAISPADQTNEDRLVQLQELLDCARENGSAGSFIVVVEGGIGHLILPLAARLRTDGLIVLNLPLQARAGRETRSALARMQSPALLVQEFPLSWSQDQVLGPGVELRRLPPGNAGRDDDRVLRRMRGWLQRRVSG